MLECTAFTAYRQCTTPSKYYLTSLRPPGARRRACAPTSPLGVAFMVHTHEDTSILVWALYDKEIHYRSCSVFLCNGFVAVMETAVLDHLTQKVGQMYFIGIVIDPPFRNFDLGRRVG